MISTVHELGIYTCNFHSSRNDYSGYLPLFPPAFLLDGAYKITLKFRVVACLESEKVISAYLTKSKTMSGRFVPICRSFFWYMYQHHFDFLHIQSIQNRYSVISTYLTYPAYSLILSCQAALTELPWNWPCFPPGGNKGLTIEGSLNQERIQALWFTVLRYNMEYAVTGMGYWYI